MIDLQKYTLLWPLWLLSAVSHVHGQTFCIYNYTDLGSAVTGLTSYGDNLFYGGSGGIRQYSISGLTSIRNISLTPTYMLLNNDNLYVGTGVGVSVYSATSGSVIRTINAGGSVNALAINSVHMFLAIGNNILQYALTGGALVAVFSAHTGAVNTVAATDSWLFSGSVDANLRKWNITTITSLAPVNQLAAVNALAIQGDSVFVGSNVVRHYSVSSNFLLATWSTSNAVVWSLAVSGDYAFAGMGSPDFSILQWQISNNTLLYSYTGHTANVLEITIGGGFMFSGAASADNSVKMWKVNGLEISMTATVTATTTQPITRFGTLTLVNTLQQTGFVTAIVTPLVTQTITSIRQQTIVATNARQLTIQQTITNIRTVQGTLSTAITVVPTVLATPIAADNSCQTVTKFVSPPSKCPAPVTVLATVPAGSENFRGSNNEAGITNSTGEGITDPGSGPFISLWSTVAGAGGLLLGALLAYVQFRHRLAVFNNQPLDNLAAASDMQGNVFHQMFHEEFAPVTGDSSSVFTGASGVATNSAMFSTVPSAPFNAAADPQQQHAPGNFYGY